MFLRQVIFNFDKTPDVHPGMKPEDGLAAGECFLKKKK